MTKMTPRAPTGPAARSSQFPAASSAGGCKLLVGQFSGLDEAEQQQSRLEGEISNKSRRNSDILELSQLRPRLAVGALAPAERTADWPPTEHNNSAPSRL